MKALVKYTAYKTDLRPLQAITLFLILEMADNRAGWFRINKTQLTLVCLNPKIPNPNLINLKIIGCQCQEEAGKIPTFMDSEPPKLTVR